MFALCVDDEAPLLNGLVRAVEASPDITGTAQFRMCSEALEWAKDHRPDVAFLDIRLRGQTGLELAEQLHKLYPALPVVFCTGYREYAFDALQLHVSGYLMKPITAEAVQREIDNILSKNEASEKLLTVQCFGNFDVFKNGKPLHFKRKRSKEVLAYLVDRRGSSVTAKEICAVLWEDDDVTDKNTMHLYKLIGDLKATLEEAGASDVLIKNNYEYAIDTSKIDCDFYRYLAGDLSATKLFHGEYMFQYPWAEETNAALQMTDDRR